MFHRPKHEGPETATEAKFALNDVASVHEWLAKLTASARKPESAFGKHDAADSSVRASFVRPKGRTAL